MLKTTIFFAAFLLAPLSVVHAQAGQALDGTANPFVDPIKAIGALPPAAAGIQAVPPGPPLPPPPPPLAPPTVEDEAAFDKLAVMYVIGGEAMLRVVAQSAPYSRPYLVKHKVRTKVLGKWVMPEVSAGRVALYRDTTTHEKKARDSEKAELVWSGVIGAEDAAGPSVLTNQAQTTGVGPLSPSQRGVMAGSSGLASPTGLAGSSGSANITGR
ncbi:MAG: hypothetical protein JWR25_2043 [Noviherbaspirillum sp.]|nr:hypothetical protein [Noviherbaspirillum sp.]